MKPNIKIVLALTLVLSAATGAFFLRAHRDGGEPARSEPTGTADPRLESLTTDVERLTAEVAAMRRQPQPAPPPSATPARPKEPEAPPTPEERRRAYAERRNDELHQLAARIEREGKDPAWSREVEQRLADVFRSDSARGSTLRRTECGSTICRLEIDHGDRAALDRFSQSVSTSLPFNLSGYVDLAEDSESAVSIIFLARDGEPVPSLDP